VIHAIIICISYTPSFVGIYLLKIIPAGTGIGGNKEIEAIYRISRNVIYLSQSIVFVGISFINIGPLFNI